MDALDCESNSVQDFSSRISLCLPRAEVVEAEGCLAPRPRHFDASFSLCWLRTSLPSGEGVLHLLILVLHRRKDDISQRWTFGTHWKSGRDLSLSLMWKWRSLDVSSIDLLLSLFRPEDIEQGGSRTWISRELTMLLCNILKCLCRAYVAVGPWKRIVNISIRSLMMTVRTFCERMRCFDTIRWTGFFFFFFLYACIFWKR